MAEKRLNLVDSSAWLEYFADGPNAGRFAAAIEDTDRLLVSSINIYEVFKRVLQQRDESAAAQAEVFLRRGRVIAVDDELAVAAARLSVAHKLPMADSVIYATALAHRAVVWTQDADFADLPHVKLFRKGAA